MFDYGSSNFNMYSNNVPPQYNFSKILAPVAIYYALHDEVALSTVNTSFKYYRSRKRMFAEYSKANKTYSKRRKRICNRFSKF